MSTTAHIDGNGGPGDISRSRSSGNGLSRERVNTSEGAQTLVLGQVVSTDDLTYLWLSGAEKPGHSWISLPIPPFSANGDWSPAGWKATAFGQDIVQHAQTRASEVLVVDPEASYLDVVSLMMSVAGRRIPVRMHGEACQRITGHPVPRHSGDWIDLSRPSRGGWSGRLQRISEVVFCLAVAPAALVLALLTAGIVMLTEGRCAVRRHTYAGLHGRVFAGVTLGAGKTYDYSADGPVLIDFAASQGSASEAHVSPARSQNPGWLRRIPLLANVVRGEMSLFGPPPIPLEQALTLTGEALDALKVTPGLIGRPR